MSSSIQNLDHLKIPLKDIQEATNNFSSENFIRHGGFGKIYKGKLLRSGRLINIVARRLDTYFGQGSKEFQTEILMLSKLEHENLVSLVGFCDEKNAKIVINKYAERGSLDNYITDPTFTWGMRLYTCFKIAHALSYIHYDEERDFSVIHRNIKSSKILLDDVWIPKLSGFNMSMTTVASRRTRLCIEDPCGTIGYVDPTYAKTGFLTCKSDIYSFGVVLFEVLFGKKATDKRDNEFAKEAQSHYKNKQLDDLINPNLLAQMDGKSLKIFSKTAYDCLKEVRAQRPNILEVVEKLEKAMHLQRQHAHRERYQQKYSNPMLEKRAWQRRSANHMEEKEKNYVQISLADIKLATKDFSRDNLLGEGGFGQVYKGKLKSVHGHKIIAAKRLDVMSDQGETEFMTELVILSEYTHKNVIELVSYCDEKGEKVIVYDYASKGSLNRWLKNKELTWRKRLEICIDIARGLDFLHGTNGVKQEVVLHRDIKSANILLHGDWKASIADFGLSLISPINQDISYVIDNAKGTPGYCDPLYITTKILTKESDIYSFGVLLFEMLCGRFVSEAENLVHLVKQHFEKGTLYEMVFEETKKQMVPISSLTIFQNIAYQCIHEERSKRPTAHDVLIQLEKALEFQKKWEHLNIPLEDIMLATQDFSHDNRSLYKGQVTCADGREIIAAKRLDRRSDQLEAERMVELEILLKYKHENIISLVSYSNEKGEKFMDYEYGSISKGSLDRWLKYDGLTWRKRLEICIDIACGLAFLHGTNGAKQEVVIHRDIQSKNVLLLGDWKAKIAYFGCSLISPINQEMKHVVNNAKGTTGYCDPQYTTTGVLTKESDIFSFGVLLFEMLCGRLVMEHNSSRAQNLVHLVRHHFEKGTIYEMVFEAIKKQMSPISLRKFQNIAYRCIHEERSKRPTAYDVLIQLKKALKFQDINISLDDIMLDTRDFSHDNLIGKGDFWSLYKGRVTCADGCEMIAVKRLDRRSDQRETELMAELESLLECTHENITSLVGFCDERGEKIMAYEYGSKSKGSLDRWLKYDGLTWRNRLEIGIDIAKGLAFLHGTSGAKQEVVIHGDITSKNVLLNDDWKAKIAYFGCSLISRINQEMKYVVNKARDTRGYCDPLYTTTGVLTKESDIYSLGVLLFEMLCGRFVMEHNSSRAHNLIHLVRDHFEEGKLYEIVFEATKKQMAPNSLTAFQNIAYQCIHEEREKRPTAKDVLIQLKKALEIQEVMEIWKTKMPSDYKRLIQTTDSRETMNQDLYTWFHKGILHPDRKVFFSFGANGGRVETISATKFQYKSYYRPNKWRTLSKSRFGEVVQISDSSSMNIQISVKAQLLSPGVDYGVYLVYKFCRPINESTTRTHKLAIKMGNEDLFPEFRTRRDNDGWMRIELHRFLNLEEETNFDAFLMGFSDTFKNEAIYVEGVEFQPIGNIEELKKASITNGGGSIPWEQVEYDVWFWVAVILCWPCTIGICLRAMVNGRLFR